MSKRKKKRIEQTMEELEKQIQEREATMPGYANQGRPRRPGIYIIKCDRRHNRRLTE